MGMFSVAIDAASKRIQFKTGLQDDLDEYRVGDTVKWRISKNYAGEGTLLDGVYEGTYEGESLRCWVVIKEHVLVAIEPYSADPGYLKKYGLSQPPREWWPESVWKAKRKRDEAARKENDEFQKSIAHLPEKERLARTMAKPLARMTDFESIGRKAFKVRTLDEKMGDMREVSLKLDEVGRKLTPGEFGQPATLDEEGVEAD